MTIKKTADEYICDLPKNGQRRLMEGGLFGNKIGLWQRTVCWDKFKRDPI